MQLLERLSSLIAPHQCLTCGAEGSLVCRSCCASIVVTKQPTCYSCNRLSPGGRTCSSCRHRSSLAGVTVASHYEGHIKELVRQTKYHYVREGAVIAARLLSPLLRPADFDLVVPVPTTTSRRRQRGFDQAEIMARAVAAQLCLPHSSPLARLGSGRQVGAARQQRLQQVQGQFAISHHQAALAGARVLLVDDVLTTGATMNECARVLKAAGAKRVWGAVLAKH